MASNHTTSNGTSCSPGYRQEPVAVVGFANRLPGHSSTPTKLWDFLLKGGVAETVPPHSRFGFDGHYDGSLKPHTLKTPGAMSLEDFDPADFDAAFFKTSLVDAIAMDPQQRMLLEVTYEALENSGITLSGISGTEFGCFVGAYAVDYLDIQMRDPEDRCDGITMGAARSLLSGRISHFLNITGTSMTIDTACSGSLIAVDAACRYLHTRQISGAIVAGANLFMSPDQGHDMSAMRTATCASGKCHTFDAKADGYCKAEAINCVILKRLADALRDGDPIRAVIRGTAANADGWTPGIASPSGEAQCAAIRAAYAAADISDYHETGYLECHGTGTLAGDPIEVAAAAAVLTAGRQASNSLVIGSIKSNIGHAEPAAGISGLIKAVLAVEKNLIPGNPTFLDPNPKIDFEGLMVSAYRTSRSWPNAQRRIASINSFGFSGSNAHVVIQDAESFLQDTSAVGHVSSISDANIFSLESNYAAHPHLLVCSANDLASLRAYWQALRRHLLNPRVRIKPADLAYTLSERRSRHYHRGYAVVNSLEILDQQLIVGTECSTAPSVSLVFTGQGAQWPQMGKNLIETFALARTLVQRLDNALQTLDDPPKWSLLDELTEPRDAEHLRDPQFSQPLVTALQLAQLAILRDWSIQVDSVVGHSSGEIAAAYAAGALTEEDAIKIAYLRGQATKSLTSTVPMGMMAVGVSARSIGSYLSDAPDVQIACYNSPASLTLSGPLASLEALRQQLQRDSCFARILHVNVAYHSRYMKSIESQYQALLDHGVGRSVDTQHTAIFFSSVTGGANAAPKDSQYWIDNMTSPVRFEQAVTAMLSLNTSDRAIIELGPSGALAGPLSQIKASQPRFAQVQYFPAATRSPDSAKALFDVAGRLFIAGANIDIKKVNNSQCSTEPAVVVDLPNYVWNHSKKYWHESTASHDWRYRPYIHHDLLGSKILGTLWSTPSFSKVLDVRDLPWLSNHRMGVDIVFPGACFCAMAAEALFQSTQMLEPTPGIARSNQLSYCLRNIAFDHALVLDDNNPTRVKITLASSILGAHDPRAWHQFRVISTIDGTTRQHSSGLIRLERQPTPFAHQQETKEMTTTSAGELWYKAMTGIGYGITGIFQKMMAIESTSGSRLARTRIDSTDPSSAWAISSSYALHPVVLDACIQSIVPSLCAGDRTRINSILLPSMIDEMRIFASDSKSDRAISCTESVYTGRGRLDDDKSYMANARMHDAQTKQLLVEISGLRTHKLETGVQPMGMHVFNHLRWLPDISFADNADIELDASFDVVIGRLLDLAAHKTPNPRILEINMAPGSGSTTWFNQNNSATRDSYSEFTFMTTEPAVMLKTQIELTSRRNVKCSMLDVKHALFETALDLVLLRWGSPKSELFPEALEALPAALGPEGHLIIIHEDEQHSNDLKDGDWIVLGTYACGKGLIRLLKPKFSSRMDRTVKLYSLLDSPRDHLQTTSHVDASIIPVNQDHQLESGDIVLVVDDLQEAILTDLSSSYWARLQKLVASRAWVLWVTYGSQMHVTNPKGALVHGLFRSIRSEDASAVLMTLDLESSDCADNARYVSTILHKVMNQRQSPSDSEYAVRNGYIHISRVLPDKLVNDFNSAEPGAFQSILTSLTDQERLLRLQTTRIGSLDSLAWQEVAMPDKTIAPGHIEVEIYSAGLNFKDIVVASGLVPEDETLLGLECAGIVRRIGSKVASIKPGDRVVVLAKGAFANRIQAPVERAHRIPHSLSFEAAASMILVYLTTVHALLKLADLRPGMSILIHSASGGIGIAAINLAKYKGADIYATVGTEEKTKFLTEEFGIPRSRIFSSRSAAFAREISAQTNGRGIDIILNSLSGELLDESWRLCAEGGTMIELGKVDIVKRRQLAMEPFDRNCSFRAFDLSHRQVSDTIVADLFSTTFRLYDEGHISPIRPCTAFTFQEIVSAFTRMRSGKHMGKIVISRGLDEQVQLPTRLARKEVHLVPQGVYLMVGGLKGLCGSLALHLAQRGANHLIIMSRSSLDDSRSSQVIRDCNAHGCTIYHAMGDVTSRKDVEAAFAAAPFPIRGVIHGAMVLRDKPFEAMTVEDWRLAVSCKVNGAINLHEVAADRRQDLDFFTLLSSGSGVVGQPGQSNYAAANVFLDAFASYRQSLGLPAHSIDLGIVEDHGYVAAQGGMTQHFDPRQWTRISEVVLRKILDLSILQQLDPVSDCSITQMITGISVPQPKDSALAHDLRFSGLFLAQNDAMSTAKGGRDAGKELQSVMGLFESGAEDAAMVPMLADILNKRFVRLLRLDGPMEPGRALSAYGLDSLAAVELRNWVRSELKAELTTLEVSNASSLMALSEKILSKWRA